MSDPHDDLNAEFRARRRASQGYVEDCQVCCRPWRVMLSYDEDGGAEVSVLPEDED
jgi:hypothetical protein